MKTIFQRGFRPASPFAPSRNPFVLGQDDTGWEPTTMPPDETISPDTGWEPTTMPPESQISPGTTPVATPPTQTTTTPTTPSQQAQTGQQGQQTSGGKTTDVWQAITQGITQGVQAGAKDYAQQQAAKAAAAKAAAARLPGGAAAAPTIAGIDSSTLMIGAGVVALVAIIAIVAR
jgi:hypothetical protein